MNLRFFDNCGVDLSVSAQVAVTAGRKIVVKPFLLFALIIGIFQVQAEPACRGHNPRAKDVPECPKNGSRLLPDSYPAMAVTVSGQYGGADFVSNFAIKVLDAQSDRPPQIFINGTRDEFNAARRAVEKATAGDPPASSRLNRRR